MEGMREGEKRGGVEGGMVSEVRSDIIEIGVEWSAGEEGAEQRWGG